MPLSAENVVAAPSVVHSRPAEQHRHRALWTPAAARLRQARLAPMTFHDLPDDWSRRPLTDPALVLDVLDLVVANRDRLANSLCVLMCDDEDRLVQPVAISEMASVDSQAERERGLRVIVRAMDHCGSVLVAVARPAGLRVRPSDLAWRAALERVCRDEGVRLLGLHVVTLRGFREVGVGTAAA